MLVLDHDEQVAERAGGVTVSDAIWPGIARSVRDRCARRSSIWPRTSSRTRAASAGATEIAAGGDPFEFDPIRRERMDKGEEGFGRSVNTHLSKKDKDASAAIDGAGMATRPCSPTTTSPGRAGMDTPAGVSPKWTTDDDGRLV